MASFPFAKILSECCSIKLQAFPSNLPFPFSLLLSLMTLSPYPPVSPYPHLSSLPPYPNGDIRTDLPANSASRALSIRVPNNVKVSLTIDFFPELHQGLRAGNHTEPAPLAPLAINFNLSHDSPPIRIEIRISKSEPNLNLSYQMLNMPAEISCRISCFGILDFGHSKCAKRKELQGPKQTPQ